MPGRVTFLPFERTFDCTDGESVFDTARRGGLAIPTACAGKGTCGLCRVKIVDGEAHLPPITAEEKKHLGNTYFITKLRLSCRIKIPDGGAVTVSIPDAKR